MTLNQIEQIRSMYHQNWSQPLNRQVIHSRANSPSIYNEVNSRAKMRWIFTLGLLLPALAAIIGVVAWAVSAEVVMGARRDAARKNSDSSFRFRQIFHNEKISGENENDLEDNGKLLLSNVQSAMIKDERPHDEEHVKPSSNYIISESRTSIDENSKDNFHSTDYQNVTLTNNKKQSSDYEKIKKTLTQTKVVEVIEKLIAQRKAMNPNGTHEAPHIVVVAPLGDPSSNKTSTTISNIKSTVKFTSSKPTTSKPTTRPTKSGQNKSKISTSTTIRTTAVTTPKPTKSTISQFLRNNKRTTKIRITKGTTSMPNKDDVTTSTVSTNSILRENWLEDLPIQKKFVPTEFSKNIENTKEKKDDQVKSKIFSKESIKIESITNGAWNHLPLFSKLSQNIKLSSNKNIVPIKPVTQTRNHQFQDQFKIQHHQHRPPLQKINTPLSNPSNHMNHQMHQQPSFIFQNHQQLPLINNNQMPISPQQLHPNTNSNTQPPQSILNVPGLLSQASIAHQSVVHPPIHFPPQIPQQMPGAPPQIPQQPGAQQKQQQQQRQPQQQMFPMFNGNNHIRNNEPNNPIMMTLNAAESVPIAQESMPHRQYAPMDSGPGKGVTLHFGGGPMGGGGQLMTSPLGIFKTLLLPLMPKPRMNLNGKVVFGVVLENAVGFGKNKKPQIIAQHYSEGHI